MGAYENAMYEEGDVEDFRREITLMIEETENRNVLCEMFLALRSIYLKHERAQGMVHPETGSTIPPVL